MCDYWKHAGGVHELGIPELQRQMDSLKRLNVKRILLSGGEPLLHPEIWGLARVLEPLGAGISLLTNGLLLTAHAEEIVRHCHEVILSLDGGQEVHDGIRGVTGAYEKLSDGVKALRAIRKGFRVTARTVVQKANYKELPNVIDAARSIGLDRISFLAADATARAFGRTQPLVGSAQQQTVLDAREAAELYRIIRETVRSHEKDFSDGFVAESPERLERLPRYYSALAKEAGFPTVACNAPWVSAVLEADGTVRPCFFHAACGNIRDDDLHRILNAPRALDFRRRLKVKKNPVCRRCVCPLYLR
jgi:MoaA/NifB/PqqE/SkfB family radical SAM enzyme